MLTVTWAECHYIECRFTECLGALKEAADGAIFKTGLQITFQQYKNYFCRINFT